MPLLLGSIARRATGTVALVVLALTTSGCLPLVRSEAGPVEPVEAFTLVPGETEPPVDAGPQELPEDLVGALTEAYGCGEGWALSNPGQSVGLLVFSSGAARIPPPSAPAADDHWVVEVVFGRDLFANWCDDVIEPGEAQADIQRTFTAVAGTVTIVGDLPVADTCPQAVTTEITDLVVADGTTRLDVGSLTVTNDSYGCFAG